MGTTSPTYSDFLGFLRAWRGNSPVRTEKGSPVSFIALAAALERNKDARDFVERSLIPIRPPVNRPNAVEGIDTAKIRDRAQSNEDALRVLRICEQEGRAPTSVEAAYLRAYSGLGGLNPTTDIYPDPVLWPPEYITAIRLRRLEEKKRGEAVGRIKSARAAGVEPSGDDLRASKMPESHSEVLYQLRNQFFTPPTVCEAMAGLALKVVPVMPVDALEPAAGIGRMIEAAAAVGFQGKWTAIEIDKLVARLLRYAEGSYISRVKASPLENAYVKDFKVNHTGFDLILSNPPYSERLTSQRNADLPSEARNYHYFMLRSMQLLRPGGVLVAILPGAYVTGVGQHQEFVTHRRSMLEMGHLISASFIDPKLLVQADPTRLPAQTIVCFIRGVDRSERTWSTLDKSFVAGTYHRTATGQANMIGVVDGSRTDGVFINGPFDAHAVTHPEMQAIPADALTKIEVWRQDWEAGKNPAPNFALRTAARKPAKTGPPPGVSAGQHAINKVLNSPDAILLAAADPEAPPVVQAAALSIRLGAVAVGMQQGRSQNAARAELMSDVEAFLRLYGNPHNIAEVHAAGQACHYLRSAVDPATGEIAEWVRLPDDYATSSGMVPPGPETSLAETIGFYTTYYGRCTETDLQTTYGSGVDLPGVFETVLATEGLCVDIDASVGARTYFTDAGYAQGEVSPRLERINALLASDTEAPIRDKMQQQQRLLSKFLPIVPFVETNTTLRSGYIPRGCLRAYFVHLAESAEKKRGTYGAFPVPVLDYEDGVYAVSLQIDGKPAKVSQTKGFRCPEILLQTLAYLNNANKVPDPYDGGNTQPWHGMSAIQRKIVQESIETQFQRWLAAATYKVGDEELLWSDRIAKIYSAAFRSAIPAVYSDAPLDLPRLTSDPNIQPRAHQNRVTRRILQQGVGVVAHEVGLGKTYTGLLVAMGAKQQRTALRPLIVVPNAVARNWFDEGRRFFPDARIAIIGFTVRPDGRLSPDTEQVRGLKWDHYAMGLYDITICPVSKFAQDVTVRDGEVRRLFGGLSALAEAVAVKTATEKGDALEKDAGRWKLNVTLLEQAISDAGNGRVTVPKREGRKRKGEQWPGAGTQISQNDAAELLARAKSSLAVAEARLGMSGGARKEAEIARQLDDLVATKPLRPRVSNTKYKQSGDVNTLLREAAKFGIFIDPITGHVQLGAMSVEDEDGEVTTDFYDAADWAPEWVREHASVPDEPYRNEDLWRSKQSKGATAAEKPYILAVLAAYLPPPPPGVLADAKPAIRYFEDLGCDLLVVDEAHNYKNIFFPKPLITSKKEDDDKEGKEKKEEKKDDDDDAKVSGKIFFMGATKPGYGIFQAKPTAWDMFAKCQYLLRTNRDRGVVLLTATPIKNSPMEVYNVFSLITRRALEQRKLRTPGEFLDRYANIELDAIADETGSPVIAYKFAGWKNLSELSELLNTYIDRLTVADAIKIAEDAGKPLYVPRAEEKNVFTPLDTVQQAIYDAVVETTELPAEVMALCKLPAKPGPDAAVMSAPKVIEGTPEEADDEDGSDLFGDAEIPDDDGEGGAKGGKEEKKDDDKKKKKGKGEGLRKVTLQDVLIKVGLDPRMLDRSIYDTSVNLLREMAAPQIRRDEDEDGNGQGYEVDQRVVAAAERIVGTLPKGVRIPKYRRDIAVMAQEIRLGVMLKVCDVAAKKLKLPISDYATFYKTAYEKYPPPADSDHRGKRRHLPKFRLLAEHIAAQIIRKAPLRNGVPEMMITCGHIVFCDVLEAHKQIFDAIVDIAGIAPERIRFITGEQTLAERDHIAKGFCGVAPRVDMHGNLQTGIAPLYDVVIGVSSVMAEGLNLQIRTCAIHHLTYTWEPVTLIQRNGRGVRQNNRFDEINIYYYISGDDPNGGLESPAIGFDGVILQTAAGKKNWLNELFVPAQATAGNPAAVTGDSEGFLTAVASRRGRHVAECVRAYIKAKKDQLERQRALVAADQALASAVDLYTRARKEDDPERIAAILSRARASVADYRSLPEWAAPQRDALVLLETTPAVGIPIVRPYVEGEKARKIGDIIQRPTRYTLIFQGHWHRSVDERNNTSVFYVSEVRGGLFTYVVGNYMDSPVLHTTHKWPTSDYGSSAPALQRVDVLPGDGRDNAQVDAALTQLQNIVHGKTQLYQRDSVRSSVLREPRSIAWPLLPNDWWAVLSQGRYEPITFGGEINSDVLLVRSDDPGWIYVGGPHISAGTAVTGYQLLQPDPLLVENFKQSDAAAFIRALEAGRIKIVGGKYATPPTRMIAATDLVLPNDERTPPILSVLERAVKAWFGIVSIPKVRIAAAIKSIQARTAKESP